MATLRAVLEVLKWADYREALTAAAVCSLFQKACEAAELWMHHCDFLGITLSPSPGTTYKEHFRTHRFDLTNCYFLSKETQCIYDCVTQCWKPLPPAPLSMAFWNCSYVLTSDGVLLCGGGVVNTNKAWLYSPSLGQVTELASMNCIRAGHGCIHFHSTIYVFGGAGGPSSCEKFSSLHWTLMAPMVFKHAWFTPAVQSSLIYLCGGSTSHCEVFHPSTEQCTALSITLPNDSEACAFAYCEDILVLQRGFITKIHAGECESQKTEFHFSPWGNCCPVIAGNSVYIPRIDSKCLRKLTLADKEEVKIEEMRLAT